MNSTIFNRSASRLERALMACADACAHRDDAKLQMALNEYLAPSCDHVWVFTVTHHSCSPVFCENCGERE